MWGGGTSYETFMGRWSRLVAREFILWLRIAKDARWVDVGCGTGGLTQIVLDLAAPQAICAVDPDEGFLNYAREQIRDARVQFKHGDACQLPLETAAYDAVLSGLMLNFVPEPLAGLAEMGRVTRPGGTVAAYVWDYAERMEFLRYFWDAAVSCDPAAQKLDEGRLFSLCHPGRLRELFEESALQEVETCHFDVVTHFRDFEDYWSPFLGGQGPAPSYVASLRNSDRNALQKHLQAVLPIAEDGSIKLIARAWAVRGKRNRL
jgi:SAM-dependent methyltransferase